MTRTIEIAPFFDSHFHGRQGGMLRNVIRHLGHQCESVLFMPNTEPPIWNWNLAAAYGQEIRQAGFIGRMLLTLKLTKSTTPSTVVGAHGLRSYVNLVGFKLYPEGVTTNSQDGFKAADLEKLDPVYAEMEKRKLHLFLHGEMPGVYYVEREVAFLHELRRIAHQFPKLKITLEHITTARAAEQVLGMYDKYGQVSGTITAHHLYLTGDDVVGGKLKPHNFCQPIAKGPDDRDVLRHMALSGHPAFRLGTDSAPHLRGDKECNDGCAGVYTGPMMVPLLVDFFESHGRLDRLRQFTVENALSWFDLPELGLPPLTVREEPWTVPADYDGVVPFMAGQTLNWQVVAS